MDRESIEKHGAADPFLGGEDDDLDLPEIKRDPESVYGLRKGRVWKPWLARAGQCVLAMGWLVALALAIKINRSIFWPQSPLPSELFSTVKRTFALDERYIGPSEEANDNWEALIAGHDVLYVSDHDKQRYGLPQGMLSPFMHPNRPANPPQNFYVMSIMHSMHCLNHVRAHYWQIKTGGPSTPAYTEQKWNVHVDHCFEYLRQSVLCGHAIFEIEGYTPLFVPEGGVATTVSGWGVEHTCIDYDALYKYQVDQEAAYNLTWQG